MTTSLALNGELFKIRDNTGQDIQAQVSKQIDGNIKDIFSYLQAVAKPDIVLYGGIGIVVVLIWQRLKVDSSTVVGIVIALIVVYLYNESRRHTTADTNRDLMTEIETLDTLTGVKHLYLYLMPRLIRFWAENVDFRRYGVDAWDKALKACDLLMNLHHDIEIGTERCSADIDVAEDLRRTILNHWSELAFNLPDSQILRDKHLQARDRLQDIVIDVLMECKKSCKHRPLNDFHVSPPLPGDLFDSQSQSQYLMY